MKENLGLFLEAAKKNIQEAKRIFFGKNFKNFYLQDEPELQATYDLLMMGKDQNQILEEFLVCTGAKERVQFDIEQENYVVSGEEKFLSIKIHQKNWGYEELEIHTDPCFSVETSLITTDQFEDQSYVLNVDLRRVTDGIRKGTVTFDTAFEHFTVTIEFERTEGSWEKQIRKKAQDIYLDFRCGKITPEEYFEKSFHIFKEEEGVAANLFRLQLAIIGKREEEASNRMEQMEEERPWEDGAFIESYYYYLKALYEKNPLTIKSAVEIIREHYAQASEKKEYYLWMLLYLDEELVYSNKRQLEEIKKLYQEGTLATILKYEVAGIWNRNPLLLKDIDAFTVENMKFGVHQQILSKEVLDQYARMIRRRNDFTEDGFCILEEIYHIYPEEYLQSICKTILRTGQWKKEYHGYLKEAVSSSIKMLGLFEAYIRTLDIKQYETLEPAVLHYFTYSNSLSIEERAYLYANVHMNRKEYGEITKNYSQKITAFVLKAMELGLMTDPAVYLYQNYLPDFAGSETGIIMLPNIIFKRKIVCENTKMKKVIIKHIEKQQPDVYELIDGTAYCDIYSDQVTVLFQDEKEAVYLTAVSWNIEKLWKEESYYNRCREKNHFHEKVLLTEAGKLIKKAKLEEKNLAMAQRLMDLQVLSDDAKEMILELLLNYYYENHENEKLEEYLRQVRWEKLQEKNQVLVMEYFILQGMYEEALKGMERYGFDIIRTDLLKKVVQYLIEKLQGRKSMFAAKMCESVFLNGEAGPEILYYLEMHIPPEADYLKRLWDQGMEAGIYQQEFTRRLLTRFIKEEWNPEDYIDIFLQFVKQENHQTELINYVLEKFCRFYIKQQLELREEFFTYCTRYLKDYGWKTAIKPLAWLHYYGEKEQLSDEERQVAESIIHWFMEQEILLEVFLKFGNKISIPNVLFCTTFVIYQDQPRKCVVMHCQEGESEMIREAAMTEVVEGIYVSHFISFVDEQPDVYVTMEEDDKKYRKSIKIIYPERAHMGLKYQKINEILSDMHNSQVYDMIEQYNEMEFMIAHSIQPWLEE